MTIGRATIISVATPLEGTDAAKRWLAGAGEEQLAADLRVLNRVLHAYRLVVSEPHLPQAGRRQLLVARVGSGAGEEVADGRWSEARELRGARGSHRRSRLLAPQARLAAVLGERDRVLACETLALRARADVDSERIREAALQVLVALDATLAELAAGPAPGNLTERLAELHAQREAVTDAAQAALAGELTTVQREVVEGTLGRIEATLRARALASAAAPPRA